MTNFDKARKATEAFFKSVESRPGYAERAEKFDQYAVAMSLHESRSALEEAKKLRQPGYGKTFNTTDELAKDLHS